MAEKSALPYVWMLLGSLSFALMVSCTRVLGFYCDWQLIALVRSVLAFLFTAGLCLAARKQLVLWQPGTLWVRSIAGSISMVCSFFAYTRLPVADVLALTNMFPIWVALLSWPLLGELPPGHVWLSVACGLAGVLLIQRPHFADGNFAVYVALAASFASAIAMIGLHRLRTVDARAIVAHFSGVAVVFCAVSFFLFERPFSPRLTPDGPSILLLLAVGIFGTVGQLFLTRAFAEGQPAKISVVSLSQIVFALIVDAAWFDRSFTPTTLAGIVLVVAPTAWLMLARG